MLYASNGSDLLITVYASIESQRAIQSPAALLKEDKQFILPFFKN